nr:50S ribosomal protein L20 [Candidatus Vampirococcus lugosii]
MKQAKGFRLGRKNVYKQVRLALIKQGQNAYIGRKLKKRQFRQLWIDRLSSALRSRGSKYSVFINQLKTNNVVMNRKVLSNIAVVFPEVFDKINEEISK